MEQRLCGQGLGFGKQFGYAQLYPLTSFNVPCYSVSSDKIQDEIFRFQSAISAIREQLLEQKEKINKIYGPTPAEVFNVQLELLLDHHLQDQVEQQIKHTLKNVEFCLQLTEQQCKNQVSEEQLLDLHDIVTYILQYLLKQEASHEELSQKIIVSKSLILSDILYFETHAVYGIILEENCPTAHATILAKHLNVPVIIGVKDACEKINTGDDLLIDGNSGIILLHPHQLTINQNSITKAPQRALTQDGVSIHFEAVYVPTMAAKELKEVGAEGIGLVRSEALFLQAAHWPTEEEQFQQYRLILQKNTPYPVVFRTWDIGGDKKEYSFFKPEPENNPFLGQRAIRFCLKNFNIFKTQLRALLRASVFGHAKLLYPLISETEEVKQADNVLEECKFELKHEGIAFNENLEIGLMLEIPSTVFILDQLSTYGSFFSIGSNDWIQYLLASDRTNTQLTSIKNMTHPAVLRSLKKIIGHAEQLLMPIHLCGEMANIPIPFLMCLGLGFRFFICNINQIPNLKILVQSFNLRELKNLTSEAYFMQTKEAIWDAFEKHFQKNFEQNKKI